MLILKKSCKALITAPYVHCLYTLAAAMMNWISTVISCNLFNGNLVQMMPRKSIQLSCLLKQPATIQKNLCLSLFHLKKT